MYVCGDADIGWGKSPIILRLNSLDRKKKRIVILCSRLFNMQFFFLSIVNILLRSRCWGPVVVAVVVVVACNSESKVPILPRYLTHGNGWRRRGPCITKGGFFFLDQYKYSIGTVQGKVR